LNLKLTEAAVLRRETVQRRAGRRRMARQRGEAAIKGQEGGKMVRIAIGGQ
jgi:hypothetical protein